MSGYRCRQTTASDGSYHMARFMSPGERSRVTRRQMASDAHVAGRSSRHGAYGAERGDIDVAYDDIGRASSSQPDCDAGSCQAN
jgi:hypothetical protein